MMNYSVHRDQGAAELISGESLVEAIEKNFKKIVSPLSLGNIAGYELEQVSAEYKEGILGGKGGVELTIVSHGSDALLDYNTENDPPKTTKIWIEASKADLPKRHEFELTPSKVFDPFDFEIEKVSKGFVLGVVCGLVDHMVLKCGSRHKNSRNDEFGLSRNLDLKCPYKMYNLPLYIKQLQLAIAQQRLKNTLETRKYQQRIDELLSYIVNENKLPFDGTDYLGYYKTRFYFSTKAQKSRLTFFRNAAKLTQQETAELAGINVRQYQKIESGEQSLANTSYKVVANLARVFGVSTKTLVALGYDT